MGEAISYVSEAIAGLNPGIKKGSNYCKELRTCTFPLTLAVKGTMHPNADS